MTVSLENNFRFVIIGSGSMCRTYCAAIRAIPGACVTGVVSRSATAPVVPEGHPAVPVAFSLEAFADTCDAVIVTTPNGLHHEGAVAAARLNKHVLTEKPLDVTREAMDLMIRECKEHGVKLSVAFQRRMSPDNVVVKQLLDSGALGRVFAADLIAKFYRPQAYYNSAAYRGSRKYDGGGPFMHQAAHNIDILCWFFGKPLRVVSALGTYAHDIEVEDHGAALLMYPNNMIATVIASTAAKPGFPAQLHIHTDKGAFIMENDVITVWNIEGMENPTQSKGFAVHDSATSAAVKETAGHEAIIRDFIDAVKNNREPAISGESARMATDVVLAIYENRL
ncbi:MAG: hypothetical protein A2268_16200 [Candidatus Raymondbacteria bacterium RifOxyA12_full_50_37]|uniref:Oxidoreductase n=1 Tax=Candidatus Raymondbacteria bacterium RIFOXYD12_FULL_49_13 TaxID=1817890 RepID=A0A1F7FBR4_UNCRA|nr:MAG: hypothetical protein A2268_16200 [Candidatus Raymondbacteria bacterium RifOxyA12_full_50_37]OGJ94339.1 MAG: hypothetical protein A2248_14395 [Candidatus Raymondbacteria bacterium RIFOXYA2_FULL_49_16]OGJ95237.1 MAG: hypothetical protein A2487_18055 [Candidatus Raymondbacteria bacterium RifOxyC12_full_50_8]OGJ95281.1 MAG: hypothetical protein A2453_05820 [Candidatus Raymondbacteria bacterium RIFOXYC2_FULL_50_21]OGK04120.1 MAG: hypothetical protein A2519_19670 [Candidatus Raymondbacteria b